MMEAVSLPKIPQRSTGKRLEWLDALRGFTMILVVAYHVAQMCFGINLKTSSSMPLFVLFRMPLFFFVSGFLAYKATMMWTPHRLFTMIWKKFKIQVIPAVVFLCVFIVTRSPHFFAGLTKALHTPTKFGYWFTWVLLIMFIIYYVAAFVEQQAAVAALRRKGLPTRPAENAEAPHCPWFIIVLWVVSLAVYETAYQPKTQGFWNTGTMRCLSLIEVAYFFHFFLFGNLVHRYWRQMQRLFDSRWFFPVMIAVAFFCSADVLKWHTLRLTWTNLPRTVAMYALMLIVVMTFRYYSEALSQKTAVGRTLQYVGQRTLDIYLLHFILMPELKSVGTFFNTHSRDFLLEQVATLGMAVVVVAACCLVSAVLRVSPFLKKYLFGRK